MNNRRVFVTRRIPDAGIEELRSHGAAVTIGQSDEEKGLDAEQVLAGVRSCDVLLSLLTEPVTREVLIANPSLLGVANYAVGFNNVDVGAATELGIPVTNTPGVLTDTTADLTWALILGAARRIVEAHQYMVAGRYKLWGPNLFVGADVSPGGTGKRKVLGIVGYGRIGSAVARRAIGFDMDVLAYDPHNAAAIQADASDPARHVRAANLDELLQQSDFVSLHPLLTPETRHMIGARELGMMKRTAYLVNVARGPVVDETALVTALQNHVIAGAALDVFEDEPLMKPGLAECENALLVPHIASASQDTRDRMALMAATNAIAHLEGRRAPNAVNPEVYDSPAYSARRSAAGA
ncbi:MAG: D-glycerate dehydrogenase [Gemmatimonadota bacterium]|nr:D-glycerate dehydrogenase [Gemmatimonadota bacterium]